MNVSLEFLCSSSFLCKFVGHMEQWILAAQHTGFHLHRWHSAWIQSGCLCRLSAVWILVVLHLISGFQAWTCLLVHCIYWGIWFLGDIRRAWRILWGSNSSEEQRVSGFSKVRCQFVHLCIKAWSTTSKLKVEIIEVAEEFWCFQHMEGAGKWFSGA